MFKRFLSWIFRKEDPVLTEIARAITELGNRRYLITRKWLIHRKRYFKDAEYYGPL